MVLNDYGKLAILLVGLIGAFSLFFVPDVDRAIPIAIIGPILGYVTGNGRLAQTGKEPAPLFKPNPDN